MHKREDAFAEIFNKLDLPVIVCRRERDLPVVFLNAAARLAFLPSLSIMEMGGSDAIGNFGDIVRFRKPGQLRLFEHALRDSGSVGGFDTALLSFQGDVLSSRLSANAGTLRGREYFFIYVNEVPGGNDGKEAEIFLTKLLGASHNVVNVDAAIHAVIGLAGEYTGVSRVYIFEDTSPTATRNTYEWCAEGVDPVMHTLQHLEKKDFNYDSIMNTAGMLITNDIGSLPHSDRSILERQGVKAIAIIPIYHFDTPLGFIGFDDCRSNREWSREEIRALTGVGSVAAALINRRNAERESSRSREIVQTVADNLEDLVYISDLANYELKFINKSMARAVKRPVHEILGQPCWRVLHRGQTGPCPFCPIPRLLEREAGESGSYVWEVHNNLNGKWYMVKDSLIKWVDGERAHLGTFVDITYRKQYEEQLKRFAATDAMTDVYNRKWGRGKLETLFDSPMDARERMTLCFIDLDGLKSVNDQHGHAVGDEMIVNTVRAIFSCIRKDDFIVRWGGDEFVLFLNCGLEDAAKVMDKLHFAFEHFNSTAGKPYSLSVSHGMVAMSSSFANLDDMMMEADRQMYAMKARKKLEMAAGPEKLA